MRLKQSGRLWSVIGASTDLPRADVGARDYQNQIGRFATVDPHVDVATALNDPQRWNRYRYVRNSPPRHTDPDGRCIDGCLSLIVASAGFRALTGGVLAAAAPVGVQSAAKRAGIGEGPTVRSTAGAFLGGALTGAVGGALLEPAAVLQKTVSTATELAVTVISTLSPAGAAVGATVTVMGVNFGTAQGTSTVKFNGVTATPTAWSATSITALVPSGATTGAVTVTVGGVGSNGVTFTVPMTSVGITADLTAPRAAGTTITWTAQPTGGTAPASYKWWLWDGATWTLLRDWSTSPTYAWTPTVANANFRMGVWARSAGNTADVDEANISAAFAITNCTTSVSPASVSVGAGGTSHTLTVTTGAGCFWSVSTPTTWITWSTVAGTGSGTAGYTVQPNTGTLARSAVVTVDGATFSVTQAGTGTPLDPPPPPGPGPDPAPPPSAPSAGTPLYYHADAIGSVRLIADQSGNTVQRHDFAPFGTEVGALADTAHNTLRFAGKERDVETASTAGALEPLSYFGARHYQNQIGRFTTVDPIVDIDQSLVDPQRWNRYTYALNNPVRYIDRDGRNPGGVLVGFIAGAVGSGVVRVGINRAAGRPWHDGLALEAAEGGLAGAISGFALGIPVLVKGVAPGLLATIAADAAAGGTASAVLSSQQKNDARTIGAGAARDAASTAIASASGGAIERVSPTSPTTRGAVIAIAAAARLAVDSLSEVRKELNQAPVLPTPPPPPPKKHPYEGVADEHP